MRRSLLTAALFAFAAAACDQGAAPKLAPPQLTSGKGRALPAVVDLRMAGACAGGVVDFAIRFSQPMDRTSVQASLSIAEVLGDQQGEVLPLRETAAPIDTGSFRWEDGDRQLSFKAEPQFDRQYVIQLPAAGNKQGTPLDGLTGADADGDGAADIVTGPDQLARLDDDFVAAPSPFTSLPFFRCNAIWPLYWGNDAPSVWRAPRNQSRPRVLEFTGVLPDQSSPPRYTERAADFMLGVTDGVITVRTPLPEAAVLRLAIAAPNTGPTRPFAERHDPAPLRPSTLEGNVQLFDEDLKEYKTRVYLDERLQVPAPLAGKADAAGANAVTSSALAGLPQDALKGLWFTVSADKDYLYALAITGNKGATLWVDRILHQNASVTYDLTVNNELMHFNGSAFRERELFGLTAQQVAAGLFKETLTISANTGSNVRVIGYPQCSYSAVCTYVIYTELKQMGVQGKAFEIAAPYIYVKSETPRANGITFDLHLNAGEAPLTDIWGRTFVDGKPDGNDLKREADDEWVGLFTSGDQTAKPIPPTLQLNDGRYYSPMKDGPATGAQVNFGTFGTYTYLGLGLYARERTLCPGGTPQKAPYEIAMLFATPDAAQPEVGPDDLLELASVNAENFVLYRFDGLVPAPIASQVASGSVIAESYAGGVLLKRQSSTLVRVRPAPTAEAATDAGADGVCGTADDRLASDYRRWQTGDRLLISHRVRFPAGKANSLDGNYDGLLSDDVRDDMIFEYQPGAAVVFRRVN